MLFNTLLRSSSVIFQFRMVHSRYRYIGKCCILAVLILFAQYAIILLTSSMFIPPPVTVIQMFNASIIPVNNSEYNILLPFTHTHFTNITQVHSHAPNTSFSCPTKYRNNLTLDGDNFSRDNLKMKARFKHPSYLYSFAGSGNTWTRVLFQYITGIATGSMWKDQALQHSSEYEGKCPDRLLICKAHPEWLYYPNPPILLDPYGHFQMVALFHATVLQF